MCQSESVEQPLEAERGIRAGSRKAVLGLWIEQTETAKFWLKVFNELKNRGLHDILIAVANGLSSLIEHRRRTSRIGARHEAACI